MSTAHNWYACGGCGNRQNRTIREAYIRFCETYHLHILYISYPSDTMRWMVTVGNPCGRHRQLELNLHFPPTTLFTCTDTGSQVPTRWEPCITLIAGTFQFCGCESKSTAKNTDNYEECLLQPESLVWSGFKNLNFKVLISTIYAVTSLSF